MVRISFIRSFFIHSLHPNDTNSLDYTKKEMCLRTTNVALERMCAVRVCAVCHDASYCIIAVFTYWPHAKRKVPRKTAAACARRKCMRGMRELEYVNKRFAVYIYLLYLLRSDNGQTNSRFFFCVQSSKGRTEIISLFGFYIFNAIMRMAKAYIQKKITYSMCILDPGTSAPVHVTLLVYFSMMMDDVCIVKSEERYK